MSPELVGSAIGRYRLESRLGEGGMGEVYKAFDTVLRRPVALKRLSRSVAQDPVYREQLLKEARHAARLNHQCLAAVHDVLETDAELFLVMEYVEGQSLRDGPPRPLDTDLFLEIAVQCCEGLVAAHEEGIVHRDIKPANIMLTPQRHVKVLDFGVARRVPLLEDDSTDSEDSTQGTVRGTPAYMSPQVLLGKELDARADLFSLGVVFYELLTGHHPFLGSTLTATADRILHKHPVPPIQLNPQIPETLQQIILKMLAKDVEERYATAEDLLVDFRRLKRELTGEITHTFDFRPQRNRWKIAAIAVLIASTVGLIWFSPLRPWLVSRFPASLPEDSAIVLMPFQGPTDTRLSAFAAGLGEDINQRLTRLSVNLPFSVMPSSFVRSRQLAGWQDVAKELGAGFAIQGRLDRNGTEHTVSISLLETERGRPLWTGEISAPLESTLRLSQDTLREIAEILSAQTDSPGFRVASNWSTLSDSAQHFYLRGLGFQLAEPPDDAAAIRDFSEALSLDPNFSEAASALGLALLEEDTPAARQEAAELCTAAYQRDPENASASLCLGKLDLLGEQPALALEHFERASFVDPLSEVVFRDLVSLYPVVGHPEMVEKTYRDLIIRKPKFWRPHHQFGVYLFGQGRYRESAEEFIASSQLAPRYYRSLSGLCAAYGKLGQWAEAGQACEASIRIEPTTPAFSNLGTAYFYAGRLKDAAEAYQTAIVFVEGERRTDYIVYGNLAEALYWIPGERERSTPFLHRALELAEDVTADPGAPAARHLARIGLYQAMLGNLSVARASLQKAYIENADDSDVRFKSAVMHQLFGEREAALKDLERSLAAGALAEEVLNHPAFFSLKGQPEFDNLSQQVGR